MSPEVLKPEDVREADSWLHACNGLDAFDCERRLFTDQLSMENPCLHNHVPQNTITGKQICILLQMRG
ncbi:hypothetical protein [Paraburkholderia ribeironis]|uniref:hypothetical protein n=1 Tax=Paraburkholderia ribeironis TaxID=1247936 RepID=UPI0011781A75|nr:hypothetical protein [Paraburkholderia ribeironis]